MWEVVGFLVFGLRIFRSVSAALGAGKQVDWVLAIDGPTVAATDICLTKSKTVLFAVNRSTVSWHETSDASHVTCAERAHGRCVYGTRCPWSDETSQSCAVCALVYNFWLVVFGKIANPNGQTKMLNDVSLRAPSARLGVE